MKKTIKILGINIILLVLMFAVVEVGARGFYTFRSCLNGTCDGSLFSRFNFLHENLMLGLSTQDPVLGYKPNPGFRGIIHHPPGWENVFVSIDHNGFRQNTEDITITKRSDEKVLAVGDSFTFGDQVKNSETWPSCVAQKTGFDVWNGGVFGYGAAQAILRAEQEVAKHGPFDTIIWSITVGSDFPRDQLAIRSSFPKPYIATVEGETKVEPPKDFNYPDFLWPLGYSVILHKKLLPIILEKGNFYYDGRYKIPGANAAKIEEIIDFAFQRFSKLAGAKRKVALLQHDPAIFKDVFKISNERKLIKHYGEKHHIDVIDSFDRIYFPEKRFELWFGFVNYGHHTPYGNRVVCDVVLNWLEKETPA